MHSVGTKCVRYFLLVHGVYVSEDICKHDVCVCAWLVYVYYVCMVNVVRCAFLWNACKERVHMMLVHNVCTLWFTYACYLSMIGVCMMMCLSGVCLQGVCMYSKCIGCIYVSVCAYCVHAWCMRAWYVYMMCRYVYMFICICVMSYLHGAYVKGVCVNIVMSKMFVQVLCMYSIYVHDALCAQTYHVCTHGICK